MLVLFFLWITHTTSRWSGAVGRNFFTTVMWIDLFVLSIVGLSYFASAITEEKENDTLGLLRMTDLDALSILMGKSTGRLLGALFILLAQLPFMLVAVTMGGLVVHQVLAGFACLLGYVFLLSNVGLFCSVVAKRVAGATMLSGAVIFALLVLPWWLYGSGQLADGSWLERGLDTWARMTPFVHLGQVVWTGFNGAIFGWQFFASLVVGVIFFGLAWLLFDRFADPSDEKPGAGFVAPVANEVTPTRALAGRAKTPALRWKDYHYVAGGSTSVVLQSMVILVIIIVSMNALRNNRSEAWAMFGFFMSQLSGLFLAFCLAINASRIFKKERDQRTLSSLLMLPMSTSRLVWEKTFGCLKAVLPGILGFGLGLTILACAAVSEFLARPANFSSDAIYVVFGIAHAFFTGLLLPVFIAWLSLRMRWGALPVGITIWFLVNFGAAAVLFLVAQEAAMILLPVSSLCALIGFWQTIPSKLEALAAED